MIFIWCAKGRTTSSPVPLASRTTTSGSGGAVVTELATAPVELLAAGSDDGLELIAG